MQILSKECITKIIETLSGKKKDKQRKNQFISKSTDYLENMNKSNQDAGFSTKFNHEFNFDNVKTFRRSKIFSKDIKARIIKFIQQTLSIFMKTQTQQLTSFLKFSM